jgi:hypothetical protein
MLFGPRILAGIADGSIDRAFRRWERPRVRPGGRQRTAIGVIGFESVEAVSRGEITADDATRAGFAAREELLAFLDGRASGTIYRIRLRLVGPDPRIALREEIPDAEAANEVVARLQRLDAASRHGAWTRAVLETIGDRPGTPAAELAARFEREKRAFKADVRKLKELGLTESLRPGYRLSPRGQAVLARLGSGRRRAEPSSAP